MDVNLQTLREAIEKKRLLQLSYHGGYRIVEPQVLGLHDGHPQLLSYQVAGFSESGDIPGWRRFDIGEATEFAVLPVTFEGPRDESLASSQGWDEVLAVVR